MVSCAVVVQVAMLFPVPLLRLGNPEISRVYSPVVSYPAVAVTAAEDFKRTTRGTKSEILIQADPEPEKTY